MAAVLGPGPEVSPRCLCLCAQILCTEEKPNFWQEDRVRGGREVDSDGFLLFDEAQVFTLQSLKMHKQNAYRNHCFILKT